MSQHPSLRSSDNDKKGRSVLKRYERISLLKDREKWKEDDSVFGLPKVKIVKFKVKKEKAVAETAEGAATPAAGAAVKAAPAAKDGAKPAADAKKEAKK
ncbi:MAG: small basic protein [Candidatus Omnitrophota bacterium]